MEIYNYIWVCYNDAEESVNLSLNSDTYIDAQDKAILGGREKLVLK